MVQKCNALLKFDEIFGLDLENSVKKLQKEQNIEIPIVVQNLVTEREVARKNQKFERADMIRNEIANLGFLVEDSENGF